MSNKERVIVIVLTVILFAIVVFIFYLNSTFIKRINPDFLIVTTVRNNQQLYAVEKYKNGIPSILEESVNTSYNETRKYLFTQIVKTSIKTPSTNLQNTQIWVTLEEIYLIN